MSADKVLITKGNGEQESFEPDKLRQSLTKAGATTDHIKEVVNFIQSHLYPKMTTAEIYRRAFDKLQELEREAAVHYSLRPAIMTLGPTGYPFEDFVSEIFKSQGYTVQTRVYLHGRCTEHETDVYCYNQKSQESFIVETKFHNDHGTKSDLQIALSVKARFDDIAAGDNSDFGGPLPSEMWLINNTKFTDKALEFGLCAGLKMISWNYPRGEHLQKLIEESGLHPVTALTILTDKQKEQLLKEGLVLCRSLVEQESKLKQWGWSPDNIKEILAEADFVTRLKSVA